jgi:proteasome lid subunit RPN8/RPN11
MLRLYVDSEALKQISAHAEQGYPHEVVGILAGSEGGVSRVAALVNERADAAHNRYKVSALTLMRAQAALEAEGHQILGYYHSHPDHTAQYSDYDRDHALPNLSYLIVSVIHGTVEDTRSWRLREDRSAMDPESIERTPR